MTMTEEVMMEGATPEDLKRFRELVRSAWARRREPGPVIRETQEYLQRHLGLYFKLTSEAMVRLIRQEVSSLQSMENQRLLSGASSGVPTAIAEAPPGASPLPPGGMRAGAGAIARTIMDLRLGGVRIGSAREADLEYLHANFARAESNVAKRRWLVERIQARMKKGKTVEQSMTAAELQGLVAQAEKEAVKEVKPPKPKELK